MTQRIGPEWAGHVLRENTDEIAAAIHAMLASRRFTFVRQQQDWAAEVVTSVRLDPGLARSVETWHDPQYSAIRLMTTAGVWGLTTSATRPMNGGERDVAYTPYLSFDSNPPSRAQLRIRRYSDSGQIQTWTLAVEREPQADPSWWPLPTPDILMRNLTRIGLDVTASYMDGGWNDPFWAIRGITSQGEFFLRYDDRSWSLIGPDSVLRKVTPMLGPDRYEERSL